MYFYRELLSDHYKLCKYIELNNIYEIKNQITDKPNLIWSEDTNGWTPLHEAIEKNNEKIVTLFINTIVNHNKNVDENLKVINKIKLEICEENENTSINKLIVEKEKSRIQIEKILTENEKQTINPMGLAVNLGMYNIIKIFREHVPCDVNYIKLAVENNNLNLLESLIRDNSDYAIQDAKKRSLAHFAVKKIYLETDKIQMLKALSGKIDLNAQDQSGATALHYAYAMGNKNVITYLETNGADSKIKDFKGFSVEDWQKHGGNPATKNKENGSLKTKFSLGNLVNTIKNIKF